MAKHLKQQPDLKSLNSLHFEVDLNSLSQQLWVTLNRLGNGLVTDSSQVQSRPFYCHTVIIGKLFTHLLGTKQYKLVMAYGNRVALKLETASLAESNGILHD